MYFLQLRREFQAIVKLEDFEEAMANWREYQPKIESVSALEASSQVKMQLLLSQAKEEASAAPDDGKVNIGGKPEQVSNRQLQSKLIMARVHGHKQM